ncbi:MAG: hypothetical protein DMG05_21675 [Acidobacteria bacterium]|nr:MAG: hypothetical protein DMG05_21675 [Acidobacteriota bacterium]
MNVIRQSVEQAFHQVKASKHHRHGYVKVIAKHLTGSSQASPARSSTRLQPGAWSLHIFIAA